MRLHEIIYFFTAILCSGIPGCLPQVTEEGVSSTVQDKSPLDGVGFDLQIGLIVAVGLLALVVGVIIGFFCARAKYQNPKAKQGRQSSRHRRQVDNSDVSPLAHGDHLQPAHYRGATIDPRHSEEMPDPDVGQGHQHTGPGYSPQAGGELVRGGHHRTVVNVGPQYENVTEGSRYENVTMPQGGRPGGARIHFA